KNAQVWVPARFTTKELAERSAYFLYVVARLRPDVPLDAARGEMTDVARRLAQEFPRSNEGVGAAGTPLREHLTRDARPALGLLAGRVSVPRPVGADRAAGGRAAVARRARAAVHHRDRHARRARRRGGAGLRGGARRSRCRAEIRGSTRLDRVARPPRAQYAG